MREFGGEQAPLRATTAVTGDAAHGGRAQVFSAGAYPAENGFRFLSCRRQINWGKPKVFPCPFSRPESVGQDRTDGAEPMAPLFWKQENIP